MICPLVQPRAVRKRVPVLCQGGPRCRSPPSRPGIHPRALGPPHCLQRGIRVSCPALGLVPQGTRCVDARFECSRPHCFLFDFLLCLRFLMQERTGRDASMMNIVTMSLDSMSRAQMIRRCGLGTGGGVKEAMSNVRGFRCNAWAVVVRFPSPPPRLERSRLVCCFALDLLSCSHTWLIRNCLE